MPRHLTRRMRDLTLNSQQEKVPLNAHYMPSNCLNMMEFRQKERFRMVSSILHKLIMQHLVIYH